MTKTEQQVRHTHTVCGETAHGVKEHRGLEGADRPEEEGRRYLSLGLQS